MRVSLRRFERYVLAEILPPLVGALASVIVLVLLTLLEEAIAPLLAKGANPLLVARLVALNVPEAVATARELAALPPGAVALTKRRLRELDDAALADAIVAAKRIHTDAYATGEPQREMVRFLAGGAR